MRWREQRKKKKVSVCCKAWHSSARLSRAQHSLTTSKLSSTSKEADVSFCGDSHCILVECLGDHCQCQLCMGFHLAVCVVVSMRCVTGCFGSGVFGQDQRSATKTRREGNLHSRMSSLLMVRTMTEHWLVELLKLRLTGPRSGRR